MFQWQYLWLVIIWPMVIHQNAHISCIQLKIFSKKKEARLVRLWLLRTRLIGRELPLPFLLSDPIGYHRIYSAWRLTRGKDAARFTTPASAVSALYYFFLEHATKSFGWQGVSHTQRREL